MSGILLVEDSRTQAHTYRCLLEGAGYSVRHAASAEQAFQLCLEATPDLVLLDQYLGDKSGLEVCRRLKSDMALQVIPIVVLTASQKERDHIAALDSGADRFLSKDSPPEELLAVVTGLLKSAIAVESVDRDTETRNSFLSGARLLAIDDSRVYLAELSEKLSGSGFQVSTALSGPAGLEMLERESFHILVIDVVMPEMDGFEVCRRARAWANTHQKQLGLLILSGQENREVLLQSLESGADDFVSKQQDMDVVLAHITSLVRRVRMMRHIEAINQKTHLQELALRDAEWRRQQAEERAKDAEARAALNKELQVAKEAAESANRAKSDFLASMSHELRTPLNGILGMNELLLNTELTERQRQFVEACNTSGKALLQQINDILDLSRIEAGKLELDLQECNLEALVYDVTDVFSHSAHQKGYPLRCHLDPSACVTAVCDGNRLRQILLNLIGNAMKFTTSGTVTVRAKCVPQLDHQLTLRFSVTDTGVGIPADRLDRLFAPFSQVDSSTSRKFGGSGLGLSICKQLVELMGGQIGVESQVGVGSTFWFEVPLPLAAEDATMAQRQHVLAGKRVLAVDGMLDRDRKQIGDSLQAWKCSVEQVATLPEALEAVARAAAAGAPFAAVLADCRLVEGDEYVLLQKLAGQPRLPIIGLSTDPDDQTIAYLHQLGVRRILRDPIRPSVLFDVLVSVLSVAAARQPGDDEPNQAQTERELPLTGHLLVAEDNHTNQILIVELLKYCGCTCDLAADGDEALEAVQHNRYDLVLMDCQLPEMDGFTATREIRRREAAGELSGHLPIIALTANALKGDRERCLEAGMDEYLSKPLNAKQLRSMLARFLSTKHEGAARPA